MQTFVRTTSFSPSTASCSLIGLARPSERRGWTSPTFFLLSPCKVARPPSIVFESIRAPHRLTGMPCVQLLLTSPGSCFCERRSHLFAGYLAYESSSSLKVLRQL